MKKLITLSIISLGIFLLAGCTLEQTNSNQSKTKTSVTQEQTENQSNEETTNQVQENTYENSKYQFKLIIPTTWEGYQVTEPGDDGTICFTVPSPNSQPFCIFQLYVLQENEALPNGLKLVGETSGLNVAADKEVSCVQLNEFQCERANEVPAILETFEPMQ